MKQKQQTKNKHSDSTRARSDQCIMDKENRLKVHWKELRNNYYAIPNVKDAELTAVDEDLYLLEVRLESLERIWVDCVCKLEERQTNKQDIKQAFFQICLADGHKDAVRFLWSDDEPCVHKRPKLQVYRFNRVNFGVSSNPFLLAATIRHHIEKYKHEFPDTVELLDRNFYVDDLISGGNAFEEALQTSRRAKNIIEAAGMDLRKWITNDANLMEQ
ncbi:uncharacterized protein TNCV_1550341 [Trichonephila clavipes]|uniref:Reverse transcriptase domain-containing protein n=1 Tax=Trichonephila clavipes TaxID=2585209 RepID=A0A8X6RS97_TRICX|nr:uncharacterized protein TNCV_1550341 [Trichonephila clavipes]